MLPQNHAEIRGGLQPKDLLSISRPVWLPASARHEWPKSFSILKDGPNGQKIETHVPAKEIPRLLVMMTFPVAGILRDRDPTVHVSMQPWYSVHRGDLSKIIGVRHEGEFHTLSFCRMIAKIGHCFATATINQSYFSNLDFLLCDFIRTGSGSPFHLVGCDSLIPPAEAGAPHHTIDLMLTSNKQRQFLAAKVRLFGYRAAPVYHAVVAELINRSLPLTYNDAALEEMQRKADKPPPET